MICLLTHFLKAILNDKKNKKKFLAYFESVLNAHAKRIIKHEFSL